MPDTTTLEQTARDRRSHARRPVIWSARLQVGNYAFDCGILNMSLSGARLRLALPLKRGAEVTIAIARFWRIPARVIWHRRDMIGLKFDVPPERIRIRLGEETVQKLQLDR